MVDNISPFLESSVYAMNIKLLSFFSKKHIQLHLTIDLYRLNRNDNQYIRQHPQNSLVKLSLSNLSSELKLVFVWLSRKEKSLVSNQSHVLIHWLAGLCILNLLDFFFNQMLERQYLHEIHTQLVITILQTELRPSFLHHLCSALFAK